jgi:hypothetical protein
MKLILESQTLLEMGTKLSPLVPENERASSQVYRSRINIDEAMKNIENLVGFYNDMQGF